MTRPPDRSSTAAADGGPEPSPGDRLDSWKEIAAFLQRDVRTVQRWEKQAGLPVHRHAEARLRTAFAYRSELEAWWRAQDAAGAGDLHDEPVPAAPFAGGRRAAIIGGSVLLAAVLIALIALGRGVASDRQPAPAAASTLPVSVLLTRFDDQAGEPVLAAALEEAVARELGRHEAVELVAPSRVRRTLRLMRRPADTSVTPLVGRELAVRDGHIPLVVAGRLHKLHGQLFLDLEAIGPSDGRVRVSVERRSHAPAELAASVTDELPAFATALLAAAARAGSPAEALEPVTTSSLPALRLYTAAVQAGHRRQWQASELLARRAIALDPEFAAAHVWVGWSMRQQGHPASACVTASSRGLHLASDLTDRETYLIAAIHRAIEGDAAGAIAAYEALRGLYPSDRLALDMLIATYSRAGRVKEAVDLSAQRAESDPQGFYSNVRAAHAFTVWQTDGKRASPFVTRARELASRNTGQDRPAWGAWLDGLPVFNQWLSGDDRAALEMLAPLQASLGGRLGRERDAYAAMVGSSYLAFGRVRESTRAFRHAASPQRQLNLAMQALALGNPEQARQWLLQIRQHGSARPALFASVGLLEEANAGLDGLPPSEHVEGVTEVTRGLIAERRGRTESALSSLRRGVELLRFSGEIEYFLAVETIARMWIRSGDPDRALDLLTEAAGQRARTYSATAWAGAYWLKVQRNLAARQRHRGRPEEARRLEAQLDAVLRSADVDHPFRNTVAAAWTK